MTYSNERTILPFGIKRKGLVLEYIAATGALIILGVTTLALWKGQSALGRLPLPVAIHLFTLVPALILTPYMFIGSKGASLHRLLGWIWSVLMMITAIATIFIRDANGSFSWIHIFTVITLLSVPRLVFNARRHRYQQHRWAVLGLVYGALLIAGFFAFVGSRFLAQALAL